MPQHVAGVRRFVHSVYTRSSQKPVALFLMGKGISAERCRYDLPSFQAQLIPTFGFPSSDNAITSGLEGTRFEPLVPVGRISVNSNELLQSYLDKIIEYDLAQNFPVDFSSTKDWQKKKSLSLRNILIEDYMILNSVNILHLRIYHACLKKIMILKL